MAYNTKIEMARGEPVKEALLHELDEAERKAWDSLARYKFQMFGYWAAIWVHLNQISGAKRPNPWKVLVHQARKEKVDLQVNPVRILTDKQRALLDFIVYQMKEFRRFPSYAEIMDQFGFKYTNSVTQKLRALMKKGYLTHDENGEYTVLTVSRCPMCGHHYPSLATNRHGTQILHH